MHLFQHFSNAPILLQKNCCSWSSSQPVAMHITYLWLLNLLPSAYKTNRSHSVLNLVNTAGDVVQMQNFRMLPVLTYLIFNISSHSMVIHVGMSAYHSNERKPAHYHAKSSPNNVVMSGMKCWQIFKSIRHVLLYQATNCLNDPHMKW